MIDGIPRPQHFTTPTLRAGLPVVNVTPSTIIVSIPLARLICVIGHNSIFLKLRCVGHVFLAPQKLPHSVQPLIISCTST